MPASERQSRRPRPRRHVSFAATLTAGLLGLFLLALAAPQARADKVHNVLETPASSDMQVGVGLTGISRQDRRYATSFTTGTNGNPAGDGWTLNHVFGKFAAKTGAPSGFRASIFTDSNGSPGTERVQLTGSAPDTAGDKLFSCSGANCALTDNTTYWLVFAAPDGDLNSDNYYAWRNTTSDNETRVPWNNGWSIGNSHKYDLEESGSWTAGGDAVSGLMEVDFTAVTPTLSHSNYGQTTVTLTIAGYSGTWYYKADGTDGVCSSAVTGTTANVANLVAGRTYKFRAFNDSACATQIAVTTDFDLIPPDPANLRVTAGVESLTLNWNASTGASSYDARWRLSGSTGSHTTRQSISGTSTTISSLTGGTTYEVGVRAVGVGPSSWTGATGTPASPVTLTASNVRKTTATLTIANYTGTNWYYQYTTPTGGTCSAAQTGTTASLTTLTANTAYTFKAYSDSTCATEVTSASTDADFTTPSGVSFGASNITETSFRVTAYDVSSYPSIRYKRVSPTTGTCEIQFTNNAPIAGWDIGSLSPGTDYSYEFYAPLSGCGHSKIGAVTFTTLATLAASAVKETTATLTITGRTTAWWYQGNQAGAQCKSVAANTSTASLTGLTGGTSYTYKAYGAAGCNAANLISTAATFSTVGLSAESLAQAGATLTIANWTNAWWYKGSQTGAQCTSVAANTTTASLALAAGTSYTYTAYSASGCATANKIADVAFSTPAAVALTASAVKETTATLTLASWTKAWWYKGNQTGAQCTSVAANTTTASLTGLTGGTSYTYKAYSKTGCNAADLISTDAAFSTVGLSAGSLTQRTATITLANWATAWWHKQTSPAAGTCVSVAASTTTASLTGLTAATGYTWTVYSAAGCNAVNKIADAAFTTTAAVVPPAPTGLTGAAGNQQVTLSWTSGGDGGAAITKWQYVKKAGAGNFETTWTDMTGSGASTTSHTVTGLTNGTAYKFKVRAVNSVGSGAESAESSAVTPALLGVCNRTAEIRAAILNEFTGKTCAQVTATDLDDITSLIIQNKSTLTSLRAGDFDGLTELTSLLMGSNGLTSLPARIFDDLTALELLHLNVNSLASLPAGVFDKLTALTTLRLDNNSLTTLPAGAFDKLTALTSLRLQNNSLTTLPAGIFDKATALTSIYLNDNSLTSLRAGVFDKLTSLSSLRLNNNSSLACLPFIPSSVSSPLLDTRTYSACGAGVTMGAAGVTVGQGVASTYTAVLDAYPRGNVTVTPASGATGTATVSSALTFTQSNWSTAQSITVTGVAAGSTTVSHTVSGGGYGSATAADVAVTVTAASLAASAITQTGATLTLTGHTGNWYYKYTSPTGGTCSTVQTGTTVSIGNLTKGTTYIFTAYSDSACSTAFTVAPAFTAATKPSAPATPAAAWGNGSVTLTWTAPDNGGSPITDYDYQTRNQTDGGAWTEVDADDTSTATTKTLTLANSKIWRLRIRAGNAFGDSNWSFPFADVVVGSPAPVAAPTLTSLSGGQVRVAWTAPANNGSALTGYSIWHKQGTGDWTEVTGIGASATSHTLTLTAGQTYSIGVEAHNARGGSNPSATEFGGATASTAATITLTASAVTETTATLTIANHSGNWYHKYTVPTTPAGTCSSAVSAATASLTGLTGGTSYTWKAYSDSACTTEITSASTDAEFSTVGLAATSVTQTTATLTLSNWTQAWWHKKTVPATPAGTCVSVAANTLTASLASLAAGTAHTWEVYSATGCNAADKIADVSFTTAATITLAASAVTETTATLTIANHTGNWYHKYTVPTTPAGTCSSAVSAATASLTGLTGGTAYTWKAYSDSGCTTEIASETFSTVGLTAGSLTQTTATLTLSNWTADWWHKKTVPATPAGTCVSVAANTLTASLASLAAGTAHTWEVYSATGCNAADKIADVSFTTAATITLTASAVTETTATLTIANHTGDWYHKRTTPTGGTCSSAVSAATASLTGLTGGTAYTWKAYSDSGCATEIASETFSTVGLTAGSLTQTTATLTLANWTQDWWHKKTVPATPAGTCVSVAANTLTASLASLAAGTAHTWEVYSATGCNAADKIADVSFTTAATITLTASAVTETTATLTIANHTGDWYHKRTTPTGGTCSSAVSAATASLTGLTGGTAYTWKAYSDSGCTTEIASETFSTVGLTAGSLTQTTATLTLSNWTADWWHKKTVPATPAGTCVSVAANTLTASLASLAAGTAHTWEVYSATGCNAADKIADVSFTTAATITLAASAVTETTATLTIANHTGDWYHKRTTPTGGTCSSAVSAATASLTGLTGGTAYTWKAYSDSGCATEIASETFSTVGLTAGSLTQTTATLTLANWTADWWHKKTVPATPAGTCVSVAANTLTASLASLAAGTAHTWEVYSATGCNAADKIADVDFTTAATVTLAASAVTETTATLTIANHTGNWYHKYTVPTTPAGTCSSAVSTATASLTGLTGGTAYTWKAYSDSGCTTEIASETFSTVGLTAGSLTQTTATLTLANWTADWWHKKTVPATPAGTCVSVAANTLTASLASLAAGTAHTWEVYSATGCNAADKIADVSFTTAATITLAASAVTETTATLTIANHSGDWYHKRTTPTGGTCSSAVSAATASLTGLTGGTAYTWKAYSDSGCTTEIASETFSTVGLSAGSLTQTTATLTLANWTADWWHKKTVPATPAGTCVSVAANTLTASLASLAAGTAHTWEVYSATGCNAADKIADVSFTTAATITLAASAVTETTATLTIANHTGDWYHKRTTPTGGTCSSAVSAATASLTGLTGGTAYTWKAYSDSGCTTEIASETFSTVGLTAGSLTQTTATLTLANWTADWWHKKTVPATPAGTCVSVAANTLTASLASLAAGTAHTWEVYSATGCNAADKIADVDFTTPAAAVTLTSSAVAKNTATLTIANHSGNWHYKYTAPTGGVCSAAQTGATANLTNLTAGTSYTFAAYSDSGCATLLATAAAFTTLAATKPAAPATPAAAWGDGSVTLTWTAPDNGGSPITDYDYHTRNQTDGGAWTEYEATDTSTATTKTLTLANGKLWRLRIRAGNAVGDSNWSWPFAEVVVGSPAPVAAPTLTSLSGGQVRVAWTAPATNGSALTGYSIWHKQGTGDWTEVTGIGASATSHTLTLTAGQTYSIGVEAHNARGGSNPSATEFGGATTSTAATITLAASAVTETTATLTIANHTGNWYHKYTVPTTPAGTCSSAVSAATASLTGLTGGTAYTWKAYSDSGCTTEIASETFSTVGLTAGSLTQTTATLTLSNWTADWWHKKTVPATPAGTCVSVAANTLTASLASLAAGTAHTWEVYSATGCNAADKIADVSFTTAATITLAASAVTETTATLTIANHTGNWYHKYTVPTTPAGTCSSAVSAATASLTGLTGGTAYTWKAYSDSGCTTEIASETFSTVGLTAGSLTQTTATLTLSNWTADWWHKKTVPATPAGTCVSVAANTLTASLASLAAGTAHTWEVYSATGCNAADKIADVSFTTAATITLAASAVTETTATLTIANHTGDWYHKYTVPTTPAGTCSSAVSAATASLTGLTGGTAYTWKAYSDSGCTTEIASETFSTVGLTAGSLTQTTATLTLANWTADWWHKKTVPATPAGTCVSVAANTLTASLTSLAAGTAHTWEVYSATGCNAADKIADVSFTTAATITLTASAVTETTATLTIANHTGDWYHKYTVPTTPAGTCSSAVSAATASLTGLTGGTAYTWKAYSDSGCATEIASETFSTVGLTAGSLTQTTATLTLANWTADWWHKKTVPATPAGTCVSVAANTLTASLTSLAAGTAHTWEVYSATGCNAADKIADVSFTTAATITLTASAITETTATLTIAGHTGSWRYKYITPQGGSCSSSVSGDSTTVTGLTPGRDYSFRAYSDSNCGTSITAPVAFTTLPDRVINLRASPSVGEITADWDSAQGATKYQLQYRAGTGTYSSSQQVEILGGITTTSFNTVGRLPYKVRVRAGNATGWSTLWSDEASATAACTTCPGVAVSNIEATSARLAVSDYAGSRWYKRTTPDGGTCTSASFNNTINVSSLATGTVHVFGIYVGSTCAKDDLLASTTTFTTKPGKPTKPTATAGAGSGKLTLSAAAVTGSGPITKWQYSTDSGTTWADVPGTNTSTTVSGTVTGLTDGTSYTIRVRAVNVTGHGAASDASDAATPTDTTLTASAITQTTATLTLTNWTSAWWYKGDQDGATCTEVAANTATASLSGLTGGTTYTYKAYSDSCSTLIATAAAFTTLAPRTGGGGGGGGGGGSSANRAPTFGAQAIADQTWRQGLIIEPLVLPAASGGDGTLTYTLAPALPEGVTFDAATRVLSGLPAAPLAATRYTYTATDADRDTASLAFTLTVPASAAPDRRPAFSEDERVAGNGKLAGRVPPDAQGARGGRAGAAPAGLSYTQNTAIEPTVLPAASGGDGALSYALAPALPQGLSFDAATRVLSGTPAAEAAPALYTYTATDEDGDTANLTFTLAVAADLRPAFEAGATLPDLSYEQGTLIEPLALPAATGGDAPLRYALQPALPQGMNFDAATRVLSGTPETRMKAARYTYTVTDADGDTAMLSFRLAATPPARALAERAVLADGLASQGRAVLGGARRALDGRFRDADRIMDLAVLRANWSDWRDRLTAAAKGPSGNTGDAARPGWGRTSSPSPQTSGATGVDAAAATPAWGQASSPSPETPGNTGDASLPPLPGAFGLSGLAGTCGTAATEETPWPDASDSRVDNGWDDGACNGAASVRLSDWFRGRRYALRLSGLFGNGEDNGARTGPDWTLWSAGDQHRIEGTPGNNRYETDWRSMHLGLDARFNSDWLAGVVVSRGRGETGYGYAAQGVSGTGELSTDVWTALPYLHGRLGGFEVWGLAGAGWGEISATRSEGDGLKEDSHLNLWLGAAGASRPLWGTGAMSLSFVADAGLTRMTTNKGDGNSTLNGLKATTRQVRLGLAGEYEASIFDGQAELTPFWQLSGRYDGGDGLAGAGLEAQAGLRYRGERLSLVAQGHWLGLHSATGYKEYGASMEARIAPLAHGRGLTLALTPRWGAHGALAGAASGPGSATGATGIGALWDTDIVRRAAIANTQAAGDDTAHVWSVDAELGYGLWLPHRLGLLTPFSELRLAGGQEQRQRLGLRLDAGGAPAPGGLQLELSGFRASTRLETDTGVNLEARLNY